MTERFGFKNMKKPYLAALGSTAMALALTLACSASEPPEEVAEELEGVFTEASDTPSDVVMHRGGPTRTGVYDTAGVLETPEAKWVFQADKRIATSPAVLADRVVLGSDDGRLYAVDLETGEELWQFETARQIRSSPLVSDGTVYFGGDAKTLYALDVETGEELWSFEAKGSITGSPILVGGTVYFGDLNHGYYAIEARTGLLTWQKDQDAGYYAAPASAGDIVYLVGQRSGRVSILTAVDRKNGDVVWSLEIDGWVVVAPAVVEGTALITVLGENVDGWVYAIDLETQQPRWVHKTENKRTWIQTAPTVAEGQVLIGDSEGRLTALDFDTGEEEWTFDSDAEFLTSLTVADQLVYFGDVNGAIIAVDLVTGIERWRFQTDLDRYFPIDCNRVRFICGTHSIVVDNGSLYMGNHAGNFYALEHNTSTGGSR